MFHPTALLPKTANPLPLPLLPFQANPHRRICLLVSLKMAQPSSENNNGSPEIKEPSAKVPRLDQNNTTLSSPFFRVKKLSENAVVPTRGSPLSAGYDLSSVAETKVPARGKALVPTDLSIAIPEGTYARVASYNPSSQGAPSEDDPNNTTIFVGNLDPNVTDEHLRQVFGAYGQLLHVKIPVGKRCGFVQFADRSCAEEALRILNGTQLGGQSVRLSWGRSPANKQPQVDPNQYGGGYYGYAPGYDTYGYAPAAQDPNMYYAGYQGYGNYPPPHQQQQPQICAGDIYDSIS